MTEAEKAYQYFLIAVPENEEQAKAYFWARKALLTPLTPPNEPLTLEELREMDGEPVWVELYQAWALVEVKQNGSVMFYGNSFSCSYSRTWQVYRFRPYRRPPEGEEEI